MNDYRIMPIKEAYNENPKLSNLIDKAVKNINNEDILDRIRSIYIIERQVMFIDEDVYGNILKFKGDIKKASDYIKPKIREVVSRIPYLEESNLAKEFNIQIISSYLSFCRMEYFLKISNSKQELLKLVNSDLEYTKKYNKFNIDCLQKDYLRKIKLELMKKLNIVESDFNMCFGANSLVRSI